MDSTFASIATLLKSWSLEISNSAERVRMLIGDAHWLTDGTHKENLIREFIRSRLPVGAQATHGFLLNVDNGMRCSREIDVLVRDCRSSCAFFDEGGVTICEARDALSFWQVKSQFAAGPLADALRHTSEVQEVAAVTTKRVWRGVCFVQVPEERTDESILTTVRDQVHKIVTASSSATLEARLLRLPTCILALHRFVIFVDAARDGRRCRLRYFSTGDLSFAVGIADMLSHIYARFSDRVTQPLDDVLESVVKVDPIIIEV